MSHEDSPTTGRDDDPCIAHAKEHARSIILVKAFGLIVTYGELVQPMLDGIDVEMYWLTVARMCAMTDEKPALEYSDEASGLAGRLSDLQRAVRQGARVQPRTWSETVQGQVKTNSAP
eukprot:TRINITY_DN11632_c0_g2_i1.p1 TRINITY_DN11632_c0_g2~~TRINITY_DN11632_c0_g2_i1.p1  ORF type:complete len:118 (+),score=21.10 TRINITY_DN11632_c0_g2_i1:77-430(+)